MAEEDDSFPPETQKTPKEFQFREFGQISFGATATEDFICPKSRTSLVAVANQYGLLFTGSTDGFKVLSVSSLVTAAKDEQTTTEPLVSVALRAPPSWIAVSSDNLTLAVCSSSDKGLQILFFDVRNLMNKNKPTKTPFSMFMLSKSVEHSVVDLQWNPGSEMVGHITICVSNGSFHVLSVKDTVAEVAKKSEDFNALSVCWSPKGKQMMIGKKDGSIQQFTPTMEIRRVVPPCPFIDRKVKASNVTWLSTLQVAVTYTVAPDNNEDETALPSGGPTVFVATLPHSKEQNKTISWRNYEDPCYSEGPRPTQYVTLFMDKWELMLLCSTNAAEAAVIGKDKAKGMWEIWDLDDSCRAQLQMVSQDIEPSPLGGAIITTMKDRLIIDDSQDCEPMPVLCLLSNSLQLSLFHIINLQGGYPNLITEAKELTLDGERTLVPTVGQAESTSTTATLGGKPKLSSKPSLLVTTSTPRSGLQPRPINANESLMVSPLQPRIDNQPKKEAPLSQKALISSFTNLAPKATTPPVGKSPSVVESKQETRGLKILSRTDSLNVGKGIPQPEKSVPPVESLKHNVKPAFTGATNIKGISSTINPAEVGLKRTPVLNKARETPLTERMSSYSGPEGDSLADSLFNEVNDFENEMKNFFSDFKMTDSEISSLGGAEEKIALKQGIESLSLFRNEIAKTTLEQHEEINATRTLCVESYAALQHAQTRDQRAKNPSYRDALVSRPLDLSDQRKMKEIRFLHQYVRDAILEVDVALNDQWRKSREKSSSSAKKTERRIEMDERNSIMKAITNQTTILHQQELQITLLGQQMDNLRLLNTVCTNYSPMGKTRSTTAGDGDLPTMANSLIRNQDSPGGDPNLTPIAPKISPKKMSQLSHLLSSRKTTPVRSMLAANKSRIIAPTMPSMKQQRPSISTRTISTESKSTECTTETSTDYSESSSPVPSDGGAMPLWGIKAAGKTFTQPLKVATKQPIQPYLQPVEQPSHTPQTNQPLFQPFAATTGNKAFQTNQSEPATFEPLLQGQSTLTYGAPSGVGSTSETRRTEIPIHHKEAASNLNNPPMVVNIKELKEPTESLIPKFEAKFEAKTDVPPGAAAEVQKVLNTVLAETQQQQSVSSMLMKPTPSNNAPAPVDNPPPTTSKPVFPNLTSKPGFSLSTSPKMGSTGNLFSQPSILKSGSLSDVTSMQKQSPLAELLKPSVDQSNKTSQSATLQTGNTGSNKQSFVISPFGNSSAKPNFGFSFAPKTSEVSIKTNHAKSSSLSTDLASGEKSSSVMRSSSASAGLFGSHGMASNTTTGGMASNTVTGAVTSAVSSKSASTESVSSEPGALLFGGPNVASVEGGSKPRHRLLPQPHEVASKPTQDATPTPPPPDVSSKSTPDVANTPPPDTPATQPTTPPIHDKPATLVTTTAPQPTQEDTNAPETSTKTGFSFSIPSTTTIAPTSSVGFGAATTTSSFSSPFPGLFSSNKDAKSKFVLHTSPIYNTMYY
nr:nuclear pore complex protein Nup214-like [Ciona intestinalis]|eukprot:XP_026695870.1 nuclear pore complex protein Nup214-like [Ciona intestinalis]